MVEMYLRKIPEDMRPWECNVNGVKYVYPAGTEQNVPAEVAALIDAYWEKQEVDYPETGISFNDLRDRPFGESTEVLFDQRVEFTDLDGFIGAMGIPFSEALESGKHYEVTFNGSSYPCVAVVVTEEQTALGNLGIAGLEDTGEPFLFLVNKVVSNGNVSFEAMLVVINAVPSATIKIEKSVIHTIDPKFGTAFRVNVWYNGSAYVADKTCAEIREAERKKYPIVGTYTNKAGKVYTMIGCDGSSADLVRLAAFDVGSDDLVVYSIYIIEDGEVVVNVHSYAGINTDEV